MASKGPTYQELAQSRRRTWDAIFFLLGHPELRGKAVAREIGLIVLCQTELFLKATDAISIRQFSAGVYNLHAGTGRNPRVIQREMKRLQKTGFLRVNRRLGSHRGNEYEFNAEYVQGWVQKWTDVCKAPKHQNHIPSGVEKLQPLKAMPSHSNKQKDYELASKPESPSSSPKAKAPWKTIAMPTTEEKQEVWRIFSDVAREPEFRRFGIPNYLTAADMLRAARVKYPQATKDDLINFWRAKLRQGRLHIETWGGMIHATCEDFPAWFEAMRKATDEKAKADDQPPCAVRAPDDVEEGHKDGAKQGAAWESPEGRKGLVEAWGQRLRNRPGFEEIAEALDRVAADVELMTDIGRLEDALVAQEDRMIHIARSYQTGEDRARLRERFLNSHHNANRHMSADQRRRIEETYNDQHLVSHFDLPRLSLFVETAETGAERQGLDRQQNAALKGPEAPILASAAPTPPSEGSEECRNCGGRGVATNAPPGQFCGECPAGISAQARWEHLKQDPTACTSCAGRGIVAGGRTCEKCPMGVDMKKTRDRRQYPQNPDRELTDEEIDELLGDSSTIGTGRPFTDDEIRLLARAPRRRPSSRTGQAPPGLPPRSHDNARKASDILKSLFLEINRTGADVSHGPSQHPRSSPSEAPRSALERDAIDVEKQHDQPSASDSPASGLPDSVTSSAETAAQANPDEVAPADESLLPVGDILKLSPVLRLKVKGEEKE